MTERRRDAGTDSRFLSTATGAPRPSRRLAVDWPVDRPGDRRPDPRSPRCPLFAARLSAIVRHDGPIQVPIRVSPGGLEPPRAMVTPLASWFPGDRALAGFRRRALGRVPTVLPARDRAWRAIAPGFAACVEMAGSGLPFQIAAERRVDRSGDPRRLAAALASGQTAYLPQVHQVLPRLMRLMVSLRRAFFGPLPGGAREECSFLFLVEGAGRAGMGLHHDGDVDAFWLQLEGRRTVTIGPRVPRGTPEELEAPAPRSGPRPGWRTLDLEPGTLFHLPARTPHAVVCRRRSLAITLTWTRAAAPAADPMAALLGWDVVSGFAEPIPPAAPPHALDPGARPPPPHRSRARPSRVDARRRRAAADGGDRALDRSAPLDAAPPAFPGVPGGARPL